MPRKKPATKTTTELVAQAAAENLPLETGKQLASEIAQSVADSTAVPDTATEFNVQQFEQQARQPMTRAEPAESNRVGLYRDSIVGLRLDKERERAPGRPHTRVLISFRDRPSPQETKMLRDEGFTFDAQAKSWGKQNSAVNVEVAKRLLNDLLKLRGESYSLYI